MAISKVLAQNLKSYRTNKDLTQEELALKCNLSRTYISDLEWEKRNISIGNLEKIANALNITPYLLVKE